MAKTFRGPFCAKIGQVPWDCYFATVGILILHATARPGFGAKTQPIDRRDDHAQSCLHTLPAALGVAIVDLARLAANTRPDDVSLALDLPSSSTERWKDVPRGTMDEVSSHVRLDLPCD